LTYHGGPLASLAADRTATLRVGDRAPDAELLAGDGVPVRLFDAYRGPHFTLIAYGAHAATELAQLNSPTAGAQLKRLVVGGNDETAPSTGESAVLSDPTGDFARIYGLSRSTLLLIRPDGYIGHIAAHDIARSTRIALDFMTPDGER
jgi:hypothetical protein